MLQNSAKLCNFLVSHLEIISELFTQWGSFMQLILH